MNKILTKYKIKTNSRVPSVLFAIDIISCAFIKLSVNVLELKDQVRIYENTFYLGSLIYVTENGVGNDTIQRMGLTEACFPRQFSLSMTT